MAEDRDMRLRVLKPHWLRRRLPTGADYEQVRSLVKEEKLHTVCQEARCPNQWECFSNQTATFLIMGPHCKRNCPFCAVEPGPLSPPDPGEPGRVAEAAQFMQLRYVVVTSVTRDDLPDGGAGLFAETIREIRARIPGAHVEVLIPDFQGNGEALQTVIDARPDVLNHNIETVPRLYPQVRPRAIYQRSLDLLRAAKRRDPGLAIKSGMMLGLGESSEEIRESLQDLLDSGCGILTLGQYLQPTKKHLEVKSYISPEQFDHWGKVALEMGFAGVTSGPMVRSSYHARDLHQMSVANRDQTD